VGEIYGVHFIELTAYCQLFHFIYERAAKKVSYLFCGNF